MTRNVTSARTNAKSGSGQLCSGSRTDVQSIDPVIDVFKQLFPHYPAAELMKRTGAKFSHCEKVIAGHRQLGAGFQQQLLQSDVGKDVLIALMGEAKPTWWVGFRKSLDLADAVRTQAELARKIEAMQRGMVE